MELQEREEGNGKGWKEVEQEVGMDTGIRRMGRMGRGIAERGTVVEG